MSTAVSPNSPVSEVVDYVDNVFNPEMIRRFDVNGPRYTSYPTADRFIDSFDHHALMAWLGNREQGGQNKQPLSLYFHIPFCSTICYYCACNKIITKDHSKSTRYLAYVERELELQSRALSGSNEVIQLHWGGGTPTFLSQDEISQLMGATLEHFKLLPDGEYSIEIDPRKVTAETVALLAELGFNRMSVGVQDFDSAVQAAVNREQSADETAAVIEAARKYGFKSVSVDLIYGLPKQSVHGFSKSLQNVLAMQPDRLSVYNYAHLPKLFKPQRRINECDLPTPEQRLQILAQAIRQLTEEGYVFIGMDHFARPDDELTVAQRDRRLHRNFQGYSTHAECDLLAFGVSAIGKVGPTYSQNMKTLDEYYQRLDDHQLPVLRGIELGADDKLRRSIIQALMCHFELSIKAVQDEYLLDFNNYFAVELLELNKMEQAGLLQISEQWISILPAGRMLVRVIAMVFDRHLREARQSNRYSRVI